MNDHVWRCDLAAQYEAYRAEIDEAVRSVLASGRYVLAENVAAFESEFAAYLGAPHAVGLNSGTDALIMALSCLGIGPGDEVLTTPFTAIPTYAAIRHVGAVPVFVDIDPETYLMDVDRLEAALTRRTRAVVAVHLFGNAVDVEAVRRCVGGGVRIVEDCAQAHGATVRGRKAGTLGDAAAFSFYPTKNLGAYGDGGMLVTRDPALAASARRRRMYGMTSKDTFAEDGINSRLDELQAAILRVKLRHLDAMNTRRAALARAYAAALPAHLFRPQHVPEGVTSVHHVHCGRVPSRRDDLVAALEQAGIQTNVYYPMPLQDQEGYRRASLRRFHLPVAEEVAKSILALPFYPEMDDSVVGRVAAAIGSFYG